MTTKEKRKHLDPIELQAISRRAQEEAVSSSQARLDAVIERIERRLMSGKFKVDNDGYLCVLLWTWGDMEFEFKIIRELEKRGYEGADFTPLMFGFHMFKVKP